MQKSTQDHHDPFLHAIAPDFFPLPSTPSFQIFLPFPYGNLSYSHACGFSIPMQKMDQHSLPCTAYVRCKFCFITQLLCAHASLQVSISAPCPSSQLFSAPTDVTAPALSPCMHVVHLTAGLHLHQHMPSSPGCQACCPPTRHAWFPPVSALCFT